MDVVTKCLKIIIIYYIVTEFVTEKEIAELDF